MNVINNTFDEYDGWSFAKKCVGTHLQYHSFISVYLAWAMDLVISLGLLQLLLFLLKFYKGLFMLKPVEAISNTAYILRSKKKNIPKSLILLSQKQLH